MVKQMNRKAARAKRQARVRYKISGTELRLYSSLSSRLKAYAIRLERVLPLQRCALSDAK